MRTRFSSATILATFKLSTLTVSLPYWPGILRPGSVRPGVMFVPIEPPWRLYSCVPCVLTRAREVPAAHDAGEAAAARDALHVDELAGLEHLFELHLAADFVLGDVARRPAELADEALRRLAGLLVLTGEGLVRAPSLVARRGRR